jgi:tRNA-dihydrouridine synthase A
MDLTDRHARAFLRVLSRRARLYTEMITTGALIHGDATRFLRFDPTEHPVAIQLGGSDPADLARCARMAADAGYDEVNLNVGCPSDRVKSGRFGACLMAEPALVAECVAAMASAVPIPVTVKTRIGIDRDDSAERLYTLVDAVAAAGCPIVIVHARNAWLDGLSPKENREIPPLRYEVVHQLKRDRPDLTIVLNGGLETLESTAAELTHVDGAMLGREAYYNPWLLGRVDSVLFGEADRCATRTEVVRQFREYLERELRDGTPLHTITRHMLGLFQSCPGARNWRRTLSDRVHQAGADTSLVAEALAAVREPEAEGVLAA